MVELCQDNDIELVLVKAPSLYPYWYEEWDQQMVDYAAAHNLKYYNFLDMTDDIGIDYTTDTYDSGLHLNCAGAEKLSSYFGRILSEDIGVTDRSSDEALSAIWDANKAEYEAEKQRQEEIISNP